MQSVLGKSEVKRGSHLAGGLPGRTGVGHGQRGGDAVRGVEQIAFLAAQHTIQVGGKRGVPVGQGGQVAVSATGLKLRGLSDIAAGEFGALGPGSAGAQPLEKRMARAARRMAFLERGFMGWSSVQ